MENPSREHRCCFTGHRPEKLSMTEAEVKKRLKTAIQQAIKDGLTVFISGMARGVDIWAAELVLEERRNNPHIKLICASPYEGFEARWNYLDKEKYNTILKEADYVKFVCNCYSKSCFQIRNCYMVDHSTRVIAAYNGESGGTRNTINYAKRNNVEIINIFDDIPF